MDYNRYVPPRRPQRYPLRAIQRRQLSITSMMTTLWFFTAGSGRFVPGEPPSAVFPLGCVPRFRETSDSLLLKPAPLTGIFNWLNLSYHFAPPVSIAFSKRLRDFSRFPHDPGSFYAGRGDKVISGAAQGVPGPRGRDENKAILWRKRMNKAYGPSQKKRFLF